MFSFAHLSEEEKSALVGHIRQLEKDLLVERGKAKAGADADPAELARDADELIRPGANIEVPAEVLSPHADSIARGKQLFVSAACVSCHGTTGKGDGVAEQRDTAGMPIHPRDFTRGIFKGSREPQQLYARIALGMPGSPMPASPQLKPGEIGDLVNFVLSLSDPTTQEKVEHTRRQVIAKKSGVPLADAISDSEWDAAPSSAVVVSPLWWRNYAEPDLQIRTLHDGNTIAIRLSWNDATQNVTAIRPQDFVDMAAIELFKGSPEPFLGMGLPDKAIDLWHWRAGWQQPVAQASEVLDTYRENFYTAREAGNLITNPQQQHSAGNLAARGFGSTTFRPKTSQLVSASAAWKDGRWTVVFRRPLSVAAEDGVSLASGDRCSIAFAIWDGEEHDRNGQKLVSIWHDLRIE
jgi:DMSO reductase family type II enzyme heme b subunit